LEFVKRKAVEYSQSFWLLPCWASLVTLWTIRAWPIFKNEGYDFALYYSIGELILHGDFSGIYVSGEQGPYYAYSPLVAPFFLALAVVPFSLSKWLFCCRFIVGAFGNRKGI